MKKQKTITLLNKTFLINNKLKDINYDNLKLLYQCYEKPSNYKISAFTDCLNFQLKLRSNNFDIIEWGINSFNKSFFTYAILCQDLITTKVYLILFTHCNNYICELHPNEL